MFKSGKQKPENETNHEHDMQLRGMDDRKKLSDSVFLTQNPAASSETGGEQREEKKKMIALSVTPNHLLSSNYSH